MAYEKCADEPAGFAADKRRMQLESRFSKDFPELSPDMPEYQPLLRLYIESGGNKKIIECRLQP